MEFDSFVEIVDDKGFARHYYFNSVTKTEGRVLNINEDYFLRLTIGKKGWNFATIDKVFQMMKDATDEEWIKTFSGMMILEEM